MNYLANRQSYEAEGSSTPIMALKIFGYTVLIGIMCMFLSFSLNMLVNSAFKQPTEYVIYEVVDNKQVEVKRMPFAEAQKMTAEEKTLYGNERFSGETVMAPKNEACAVLVTVMKVIEQAAMLAMLVIMVGYYVHREGDRDRNLVKHHDRKPTPLKGLWIGLLASVPAAGFYALLIVGKCGVMSDSVQGVYRLANAAFLPLINVIMPQSVHPAVNMTVWQLVLLFLLLLIVPAACAVAYHMGYKRVIKRWKKKHKKAS